MENNPEWFPPEFNNDKIKTGDMPGDKIKINDSHINRANKIYPHLRHQLQSLNSRRLVVSVYGGSGVGKSEISSILAHYCTVEGYNSYILSGDNYPHRIPEENDIERLRVFRTAGLNSLSERSDFNNDWMKNLSISWKSMEDFLPGNTSEEDSNWRKLYFDAGRAALKDYLGTNKEINFTFINRIIHSFKNGENRIVLKKMGKGNEDMKLESVSFSDTRILFVEWTHGNSPELKGIDLPIFLFSSPEGTLSHRLSRGRDNNIDNPFINLVLEIEQEKLTTQADKAELIVAQNGEIIPISAYKQNYA